jgi:HlyD family secretion protein
MDRPVERVWMTRSRAFTAAALLLLALAAALAYQRYGARSVTLGRDRVVLSTVSQGAFVEYIPLTANVEPRETVYLDAVDGGQVAQVLVEEGVAVKQGQPLVRLNNTALQLQVISSEAQLSEQLDRLTSTKLQFEQGKLAHSRELIDVRFQIEQAAQRLKRLTALTGTGVVRRADVEDAELELDRLHRMEAAVAEAQSVDQSLQSEQIRQLDRTVAGLTRNLDIARQNLENLTIKAPFEGQLTTLDAHLGQSKRPGERVGQVDRLDGFKAVALVDEHYLPRVAVGQVATLDGDGSAQRLELIKTYPEVRERQFKVDLAFTGGAPSTVRRGQTLQLRLKIGGERRGLVVANGPFYEDTGGQWVFVVPAGSSQAQRRGVTLGRRNLDQVEVLGGLAPGDRVIVSGYESFKNVDRIYFTDGST